MADATCALCGSPITDTAVIDRRCAERATGRMLEAADLWPELAVTVARQDRLGAPGPRPRGHAPAAPIRPGGDIATDAAAGWPSGLPVNLAAADVAAAVRNTVATWARIVCQETGAVPPTGTAELMRWLSGRMGWVRYRQWAAEAVDELGSLAALIRQAVDRPVQRRYIGPCGAPGPEGDCEGELYARPGAESATCPSCGATWDVPQRRRWLDGLVADRAYSAAEIADAYGVSAERIRQWAHRGRIAAHGRDAAGRPRYLLREVLAVARRRDRMAA